MTQFKLVSGNTLISEADCITNLNWPGLRGCESWSVWFQGYRVAAVDWAAGEHIMRDGDKTARIPRHDLIVPTVRGILLYRHIFGMLVPGNPVAVHTLET